MSSVTRSRAYPKVAHGTGQLIYKTLATVKRLTLLGPTWQSDASTSSISLDTATRDPKSHVRT